jgi:putative flavoprotein involved in K+ transport
VHLVTGNAPRCARFYRGRDVVDWLTDIGQYEITVADEGMGRKRQDTNHYLTGRDGDATSISGFLRNRACRSMGA